MKVSSDGSKWAAYNTNDSTLYIGNITSKDRQPLTFTLENNAKISDFEWRPNTHELVLSGYNIDTKYSVMLHINVQKNTSEVMKLTDYLV